MNPALQVQNHDDESAAIVRAADLTASLADAEHHLDESVSLLRQSRNKDELRRGLLARAVSNCRYISLGRAGGCGG